MMSRRHRDFKEEIRSHTELEAERLRAQGLSPEEAGSFSKREDMRSPPEPSEAPIVRGWGPTGSGLEAATPFAGLFDGPAEDRSAATAVDGSPPESAPTRAALGRILAVDTGSGASRDQVEEDAKLLRVRGALDAAIDTIQKQIIRRS